MRHYLTLVLTILIVGFTVLANADTIYLEPCDDMYSDPNGSQVVDQLWVANFSGTGNFQQTMIRFDLSQLTRQTIESAILNLYLFFGCPMDPTTHTRFYAITQDWDENTWPVTQHIAHGTDVWASCDFNANEPGWYNIDITTLVQAWVDESVQDYGLVIIANSGDKFSKFYSKEHSNPNLHPYLEINYTIGIGDENYIEMSEFLSQNYPNPFNTETTIQFNLPKSGNVKLTVYNSKGQIIKTLVDRYLNVGEHRVELDASNLISGIYFYKIQTDDFSKVKKTILIK
jgi:hypothetical protein